MAGGTGTLSMFTRYARRENVDRANTDASYSQHDGAAQAFLTLSRWTQLFGGATVTRHGSTAAASTYWQFGGEMQVQVPGRSLWLRGEATASRNVDILTDLVVPRTSLSFGLNGQLTPRMAVAVNVYADRAPALFGTGNGVDDPIDRARHAHVCDAGGTRHGFGRGWPRFGPHPRYGLGDGQRLR